MREHGLQENGDVFDYVCQLVRREFSFSDEGGPLNKLLLIGAKLSGEGDWLNSWDFRGSPSKRVSDGFGKNVTIEVEVRLEPVQIIEIFHAAVVDAERNHCFQFLGDDGFQRIGYKWHVWVVERA